VAAAGLSAGEISSVEARERAELDRRVRRFRAGRLRVPLGGRTAIVVDDGIATGSTARAACHAARAAGARRVVLAVPVGPPDVTEALRRDAVEVVCLHTPERFAAIGQWYAEFTQTRDDEVVALLNRAAWAYGSGTAGDAAGPAAAAAPDPPGFEREIILAAGQVKLPGHLAIPDRAAGVVIFAHGSGSSRRSPRNRFVAAALNQAGVGTLLADLLTPGEELSRATSYHRQHGRSRRRDRATQSSPCGSSRA
jgi:putative phosphoribosyl transferase